MLIMAWLRPPTNRAKTWWSQVSIRGYRTREPKTIQTCRLYAESTHPIKHPPSLHSYRKPMQLKGQIQHPEFISSRASALPSKGESLLRTAQEVASLG